jgi:hypothetical protein
MFRAGLLNGSLPGTINWEHLMAYINIRIEGHLDKNWLDYLEGITVVHTAQNQTLLRGSVQDQTALYGLITKLRDLGVKLVSIKYGDNPLAEKLGKGQ